jgi:hypothetical protein
MRKCCTYPDPQSIEGLHNLQRKLSRRRHYHRIQWLRVVQQLVDDGQRKRARLATSGLSKRDDIPALQAEPS